MAREETPSLTFWKKSLWPIPHPEITPRPVTTTRFFSAASCVEDMVRAALCCGWGVNALAVVIPITMRLGVENFMLA